MLLGINLDGFDRTQIGREEVSMSSDESESYTGNVTDGSESESNAEDAVKASGATRASKLAECLHRALEDCAADEQKEYEVINRKKKFKQMESRYVVKLAAGIGKVQVLSQGCRFAIAATMGTIARMCGLGVGKELTDDLCTLGTHRLVSDLIRRPGCQPDVMIATRGCHCLKNMLSMCGKGPARLELQAEFVSANVPVALANVLQAFPEDVECSIEALSLCSLLCRGSKASAKVCRRVGLVRSVQHVLVIHAEKNALTKQLVLQPAKECLKDIWFGAKKKRLTGEAP